MSDFITSAELRIEAERLCDENERLKDENARLRSCLSDDAENARQIMGENAKLREYAESYAKAVECEGCGWCPYDTCAMCDVETMPMRDGCKLYDEMRELGIEVQA